MTTTTKSKTYEGKKTARDIVLDKIIETMEKENLAPWKATWIKDGIPRNAITGRKYSGINVLLCWFRGFNDHRYMTFVQATQNGASVKKGEHGSTILYYGERKVVEKDKITGEEKVRGIPYTKYYYVFNVSQVEGFEKPKIQTVSNTNVEDFLKAVAPEIIYGKNPCYSLSRDKIGVPVIGDFETEDEYYLALFHELVHWTGAKHRMGRDMGSAFGTERYSKEELVAEIGASFLMAEFGLNVPIEGSVAYVKSWLEVLKNDRSMIFTAAAAAQKAVDYLLGFTEVKVNKEDAELVTA